MFNFVHEVRQKMFIYFTVRREPKTFENHWHRVLNKIFIQLLVKFAAGNITHSHHRHVFVYLNT
jgi:hypothetical protein